eukprot:TRINITY_DN3841_c0_g1_i7.p1 TRINITY_DN3841_c0_g1~~TRINITY_DN3841_c0_g1_i7.p1  ORF type:complete len:360 (+),score=86.32 TRINITY_DN3841_c0_g1_i7:415-1494(+)
MFFVFRSGLPVFSKISICYLAFIEIVELSQFLLFQKVEYYPRVKKTMAVFAICAMGVVVISLEVCVPKLTNFFGWCAYILWAVETLPQIHLNMSLSSTDGQSTPSVVLITITKSCSTIANYALTMPLQGVVRDYYACSCSYINVLQIVQYHQHWGRSEMKHSLSPPPPPSPPPYGGEHTSLLDTATGTPALTQSTMTPKPSQMPLSQKLALGVLLPYCLFVISIMPLALLLRTRDWRYLGLPAALALVLLLFYVHTHVLRWPAVRRFGARLCARCRCLRRTAKSDLALADAASASPESVAGPAPVLGPDAFYYGEETTDLVVDAFVGENDIAVDGSVGVLEPVLIDPGAFSDNGGGGLA